MDCFAPNLVGARLRRNPGTSAGERILNIAWGGVTLSHRMLSL